MGVDDGDEDRECGRCHETMHIPPGAEPSEFCHDCAHSLVDELRARVAELEGLLKRARPRVESFAFTTKYEEEARAARELAREIRAGLAGGSSAHHFQEGSK